jgi:hypothetical protein
VITAVSKSLEQGTYLDYSGWAGEFGEIQMSPINLM